MTERPLDGFTVLDASQGVAGPTTGSLLADYGADVISIEPPGGGSQRRLGNGSTLLNVSRNKRSIALNLKSDDGLAVFHDLVSEVDVLLHNHPPGRAERFGSDYETVSDVNPGLVYCSITGFGETGEYTDRPGTDPLAQAMSGLMWATGEPDRKPSRVSGPVIDYCTGVLAAFSIVTALHHARETGEGQKVEATLYDTAAAMMGGSYTAYDKTGTQPQRMGDSTSRYAPCGVFETKTGPVYIAVPEQYIWERLCEAVDRDDWLADPRFETNDDRRSNREALREEIEEEFSNYEREDLLDRLLEEFIMASEVHTVAEAAHDDHLYERGTLRIVEDDGEEVVASASPVQFSETPGRMDWVAPGLGEHSADVLRQFGYDDETIEELVEAGVVEGA